jgi:hypothetical protein
MISFDQSDEQFAYNYKVQGIVQFHVVFLWQYFACRSPRRDDLWSTPCQAARTLFVPLPRAELQILMSSCSVIAVSL